MRFLYTAVLFLLLPYVIVRLLILSVRNPDYRKRLQERLGFVTVSNINSPLLWIHAVSVGEVQAAKPLINRLQTEYPQLVILITTMTPTGAQTVEQQFGNTVVHQYIPYDLPFAVNRFLSSIKPAILIVMETEIWPNLFFHCRNNNIPVIIANARLSEKSYSKYKRLAQFTRNTLSRVTCVLARGNSDAMRFIDLGVDEDKVLIMGNLKFDIKFPESLMEQAAVIRRYLSVNRLILMAASTHEGEDKILLDAFKEVLEKHQNCLLIIAPRHPERFETVAELSIKSGFKTVCKSQNQQPAEDTQVFILDTLGELPVYYAASDVAFIGGSLVPVGGHNMLEPASLGVPVITGPHNYNFEDVTRLLEECGAAWVIHDTSQLIEKINLLLSDANLRHSVGEKGRKLVESNRGNVNRLMEILKPYLIFTCTNHETT